MFAQKKSAARKRFSALLASVACVIAFAMPAVGMSGAAHAATDGDWWYSAMGVAQAHNAGWTGTGVKVAVIDDHINPDSPALTGANITVDDSFVCSGDSGIISEATAESLHGTHVTQMLVRPSVNGGAGGIAPDAEIMFYALGRNNCPDPYVEGRPAIGRAIIAATDAGADVISISRGAETGYLSYDAVAYALAKGVAIVSSSPNNEEQMSMTFPVLANGVVSVAAVSDTLSLMTDGNDNEPVVTPEITVVAPGIDIGVVGAVNDWSATIPLNGSSLAAPLVSGALALAKQKNPEATGDQLVQALISSTVSAQQGIPRDAEGGYGYGVVSLSGLLAVDASTLPDENPLMDKSWGSPTQAEVDAHRAGGSTPTPSSDPKKTEEPKPTSSPSTGSPSTPDEPAPWPWIVGGGIAALGAVVIIFTVMRFRRDAGRS